MISIVMSYNNRKPQLLKTLYSFDLSKNKNFEVIIVDDCSNDTHKLSQEDFEDYNFKIKIIELNKNEKWYINPCIPYNIGFKHAKGEKIIIQNPECYHHGDILDFVDKHLKEDNYLSFSAYSLAENETIENVQPLGRAATSDGMGGWYNHPTYIPRPYHFCSAITKDNLMSKLGGFDERFAEGIGYDDNELLFRIYKLGLTVAIISEPFVYHQWHYHSTTWKGKSNAELYNRVTQGY